MNKSICFLLLLNLMALPLFATNHLSNKKNNTDVRKVEGYPNLFEWEGMYFSGQPSLDEMEWMKSQGVSLILNLRTPDEMKDFKAEAFDEEEKAGELGIAYISVPVNGYDDYTPEKLKEFSEVLSEAHNKVLIHCRSCGRVTYFIMAYLIRYRGFSVDEAVAFGKKLKFNFPLENLLGEDISMHINGQD